jgi:hypothetical protein
MVMIQKIESVNGNDFVTFSPPGGNPHRGAVLVDDKGAHIGNPTNPLSMKQVDIEGEQIGIKDNPFITEQGELITVVKEILIELKKIETHLSLGSDENIIGDINGTNNR